MYDSYGTLTVRTYTAGGAVPVAQTRVRIFGAEGENESVVYSAVTDEDGRTERISLPAPGRILSEAPDPASRPYSIYDVEIDAEGYYPKRVYGVTVFSDTDSILPVGLIPDDGVEGDYPRGSVNATIPKNEPTE